MCIITAADPIEMQKEKSYTKEMEFDIGECVQIKVNIKVHSKRSKILCMKENAA